MKLPMFEQSNGEKSASFTMMAIAFGVITIWLLLSIVEEIAGVPIREFNGAEAMAYFTPLAALYFGRRWTTDMGSERANKLLESVRGNPVNSVPPPPPPAGGEDDEEAEK